MSHAATAADSRALRVLQRAFDQGRLAHALLLQGARLETLDEACQAIAGRLLASNDPAKHPDFFALRPANKMRRIGVDATRGLIKSVQQTANQGGRKVAVVYEADRFMPQAANAFLKTLEEPPADTTLFLLTTRPHDLLPTIRSRCLLLNFPAERDPVDAPAWQAWREDYGRLLALAAQGPSRETAAELILGSYGLINRFLGIREALADEAWKAFKVTLPPGLEDEQVVALETGYRKTLRARLLAEIEEETREAALNCDDPAAGGRRLDRAVQLLEMVTGLLELNLQEGAALEYFFLANLRSWARG